MPDFDLKAAIAEAEKESRMLKKLFASFILAYCAGLMVLFFTAVWIMFDMHTRGWW
jgi:hypothetical protein